MLQKFKVATWVFILCLLGLTVTAVFPSFAEDSVAFAECQKMKWEKDNKAQKNCFRELAISLQAEIHEISIVLPAAQVRIGELETQLSIENEAQASLNAKVEELEAQLSELNGYHTHTYKKLRSFEIQLMMAHKLETHLLKTITALKTQLSAATASIQK
jgi:chromosome segregation ATPase